MVTPDEINIEMVEAIIKEGNCSECKWLQDLLENGIKIYNTPTGRYLKPDSFLKRLTNEL